MNKRKLYAVLYLIAAFLMLQAAAECSITSLNNRIISSPIDGRVYNFRMSRKLESGWPVQFTGSAASGISACEYDDDINTTEYALFIKNGDKYELAILSEDGKRLNGESSIDRAPISAPAVIKTGLRQWTLFAGSTDGNIYTLPVSDISSEPISIKIDDGQLVYALAVDMDNKQELMIAASAKGKVKLLNLGAASWEPVSSIDINEEIVASPVMIDINKDGQDELVIPVKYGGLYAYSITPAGIFPAEWSAIAGSDITAISMMNGNIVCTTINDDIVIFDKNGKVIKKIKHSSVLGTDYILYSAENGMITETGPFHHFEQPDAPEYYIPPIFYYPDIPDALRYAVRGRDTTSPTYEVIYAEIKTDASYMGDSLTVPRKIIIDTINPSFESFKVTNKIFSPNEDGYNDYLSIKLRSSEKADLYVKIINKGGSVVKEETVKNIPAFLCEYTWDGKDKDGKISEEEYVYNMYLKDFAGNISTTITGEVKIDMTPYLILVGVSPEAVSNTRNGAQPIKFDLKVFPPCTLEAYITYNSSTVKTLVPESIYGSGDYVLEWDGRDDSNEKLAEGNYNYVFNARFNDLSANSTGIVRIDNTKPYVTQLIITPEEISDRSAADCALSYYLSESCFVNMDIIDPEGHQLSNIASGDVQEAKAHELSFNKSKFSDQGVYTSGTYTVKFGLKDEAGNENIDESLKVSVVTGLNLINVSADPATFTPNNDNHDDYVTIKYSISGASNNVVSKVTLKTLGGAVVKTFTNTGGSGDYYEVWDGRDEQGNLNPDGQYKYEISADEDSGTSAEKISGDLTLVSDQIITIYADPTQFSPNGDNIADITKIYYTIDYKGRLMEGDSNVQMNIYAPDKTKVYYFSDSKDQGSYYHIWDASNNVLGGACPDATYKLEIRSTDPTGTIYSYVADLIIDRGPPSMEDMGPTVSVITPNGDGQYDDTTIQYKIMDVGTSISSMELKIYNSATTFDATTLVRSFAASSSGGTLWDGKVNIAGGNGDADGNGYADMGKYKYTITAGDVLGNVRTVISSFEIQVDKIWITLNSPPIGFPSYPYFSPNGDGIKDSTTVRFQLAISSEAKPVYLMSVKKGIKLMALTNYYSGKITVKVKDMSGSTIKTLMDAQSCYALFNGVPVTYEVTWDGTNTSGVKAADNPYTIEVTAVDMIGDPATNSKKPIVYVDIISPEVSFTTPAENSWQGGTFNISGNVTDNVSQDSYYLYHTGGGISTGNGAKNNQVLGSFNTTGINTDTAISLIATDEAGNSATMAIRHYNIDNTPPVISNVTCEASGVYCNTFNPYTDYAITFEADLSENSFSTHEYPNQGPAHTATLSAEVWLGPVLIKCLTGSACSSNAALNLPWDGKNLDGDYVNEGEYKIKVWALDLNGNSSSTQEYMVNLKDDQIMTSNVDNAYSHDPYMTIIDGKYHIKFVTGENVAQNTLSWFVKDNNVGFTANSGNFFLQTPQIMDMSLSFNIWTPQGRRCEAHSYMFNESNVVVWESARAAYSDVNGTISSQTILLPAGRYRIYIWGWGNTDDEPYSDATVSNTTAAVMDRSIYTRYKESINGVYEWTSNIATSEFRNVEQSASGGTKTHKVFSSKYYESGGAQYLSNKEIIYSPGEIRLSNGSGNSINPAVATSSDGQKVIVVWEDWRSLQPEIYIRTSNNGGSTWQAESVLVSSVPWMAQYPSIAMNGNIVYVSYVDTKGGAYELYVIKSLDGGSSWSLPVRITRNIYSGGVPGRSSLAVDVSGNGYIAWDDTRSGQKEILFQKIPSNFAPFSGTTMTTYSVPVVTKPGSSGPITLMSAATPELISPVAGAAVKSLRPTFRWYGAQGVKDYRLECSTASDEASLAGSLDYFTTTISDVTAAKPVCEYIVPEHSMGLEESTPGNPYWYWRVKTINTTEATTSEVGSFKIELPATLTSVTNWPNPFNPNKEKTKIRYRLGRDADSVSIRIYDITGALVREIDGTCNAEGASIWNKYNDVEWDGRNGRGDMVLNGVYPFEVTANYGNRTVTARGKAAILK